MDFDKTFNVVAGTAGKLQTKLNALGNSPVLDLNAKRNIAGSFGNGQWKYQAGIQGGATVQAFTTKDDKDPDAIFGATAKEESAEAGPVIFPVPGTTWLKYALAWSGNAQAGAQQGLAKISFSGSANASLGAYCPAKSDSVLGAALRHPAGIPLVFDVDDVRRLAPAQAAFSAIGGSLSAKLEFNWADVLTGPLKPLQALTSGNAPVNLSIDVKAGFAAEFSISDSFRLVFVGADADYVTVVLNRASSDAFAVTAGVGAVIRLEKPDMARDVLSGLVAQLLGVDRARLADVRGKLEKVVSFYDDAIAKIRSEVGDLAGKLDAAIDAQGLPVLLTRLQQLQALAELADGKADGNGIGANMDQIAKAAQTLDGLGERFAAEIGDKLDELLASLGLPAAVEKATKPVRGLLARINKIESALLSIAKKRIEVGLSFEYRRIATDATVLRARLRRNHPDFAEWHGSLLALDAARVLGASSPTNENVVLDLFLNKKTIKRTISLGLDLGWFYTDVDKTETEWTISDRRVSGASPGSPLITERRSTLKGSRSREEKIFGSICECSGQFDADFQAMGDPGVAGQWNFALALTYSSNVLKADRSWLLAVADYATVWGVIKESQIDALVKLLEDDGAIGSKVEVEISYVLDKSAWSQRKLFDAIARTSDADLAQAFAMALQRVDGFPERATPSARKSAYSDALAVLLGKAGVVVTRPPDVAKYVAKHLANASSNLVFFEKADPIQNGSVASIVKRSGSFLGVIREFRDAGSLAPLAGVQAAGGNADRKLVQTAFRGFDLAWRDRLLLRWQVALLRQLVARAGLEGSTCATMKVTSANKGKARVFSADLIGT